MMIKFKSNIKAFNAKKKLETYHLELYSKINTDKDFETLINHNEIIVVKLQKSKTPINNYVTKYPKVYYSGPRFGNLPEVEYCRRTYSIDGSQYDYQRIYLLNDIAFKTKNDSISIDYLLRKYQLKDITTEYTGVNVYRCEITDYSPKDPLTTANELQEDPNILWASPNFAVFQW